MAGITDYASLVSAIQDYHDRASDPDFTARIDTFIQLAQDEWSPTLMSRSMETSVSLTTASDGSASLPSDFYRLRTVVATVNGLKQELRMIGPGAEAGLFPTQTGDPTYAKIINPTFYVVPPQVCTVKMYYYALPTGLSSTNTTNWILLNHPTFYFYGVMEQACLWLKAWDEANTWKARKEEQFDEIIGKFGLEYYMNTDTNLDTATP